MEESNGGRLISCIIKRRTPCHLYRFYLCVNLSELIISMRAAGLFVSNYCVITNTSSRLRGLNKDFNWLWKEEAGFRPSCPWWQSLQPFRDGECSKWIVQQWMFDKDDVAFWPFTLCLSLHCDCRIFYPLPTLKGGFSPSCWALVAVTSSVNLPIEGTTVREMWF